MSPPSLAERLVVTRVKATGNDKFTSCPAVRFEPVTSVVALKVRSCAPVTVSVVVPSLVIPVTSSTLSGSSVMEFP